MLLQEFDVIIDRMKLAFETAQNLGHFIEAARILYQINEMLPEKFQVNFDLDDPNHAKQLVSKYENQVKTAITDYREELMMI